MNLWALAVKCAAFWVCIWIAECQEHSRIFWTWLFLYLVKRRWFFVEGVNHQKLKVGFSANVARVVFFSPPFTFPCVPLHVPFLAVCALLMSVGPSSPCSISQPLGMQMPLRTAPSQEQVWKALHCPQQGGLNAVILFLVRFVFSVVISDQLGHESCFISDLPPNVLRSFSKGWVGRIINKPCLDSFLGFQVFL